MSSVAGIPRRLLATAIDFVVVPLVSILLMLISGVMEGIGAYIGYQTWIRGIGLGVAGYLLVNAWLLLTRSQTLGKALLGLEIATPEGAPAPFWRSVIRALFFPLLYLPPLYAVFGWLVLLPVIDLVSGLRKDRRCLHDLVAGTVVQRRNDEVGSSA